MKYNCTFYLDKEKNDLCPINAAITYGGDRLRYFTGIRIKKENFISQKTELGTTQNAKKNSQGFEGKNPIKYNVINNRMTRINLELSNYFHGLQGTPSKADIQKLLDKVCGKNGVQTVVENESLWNAFEKYKNESDTTALSKKQINSLINHFKNFGIDKNIELSFDNITGETIAEFEKWLKNGSRGRNYISVLLKKLHRFFTWSIKEQRMRNQKITIIDPFINFTITPEIYGTPIILQKSERDILYSYKFEKKSLCKVRDIFVFQCYCGARISDLLKLKKSNLQDNILRYVPMKTSKKNMETVEIPLNSKAIEILKKYNDPEGYLLPRISDVKINKHLKSVFKEAGLNRSVGKFNSNTGEVEFVPLYSLATTHLARRTFAGLLYAAGEKDDVIGSMTGHSENSKAFKRYRTVDLDLKIKAIENQ